MKARRWWQRWLFAAKVASWPKTVMPVGLGVTLGATVWRDLLGKPALLAVSYVFVATLAIVFLNDWADQAVDRLKRRLFPQTSLKTIPDEILSSPALLGAGLVSAATGVLLTCWLAFLNASLAPVAIGGIGMLLFWAYSLPPLRLNYRGGGEWCETIGVAIILPLFGIYAVGGEWRDWLQWPYALALVGLAWCSAAASGLADESSDRLGGKKTYAVCRGNSWVRNKLAHVWQLSVLANIVGLLATDSAEEKLAGALAALAMIQGQWRITKASQRAQRDDFAGIRSYKQAVNDAIVRALLAWSLGRVIASFVVGRAFC